MRVLELTQDGKNVKPGAPLADDGEAYEEAGQRFFMIADPRGAFSFRGGRVSVSAVSPEGRVKKLADPDLTTDQKVINFFKSRGMVDYQTTKDAAAGRADGMGSHTFPEGRAEPFDRRLDEALRAC
jgi:hypothetical protein